MTPDRKHLTAAFWITVAVVVVLAGYPLSFGPALWLRTRLYPAFTAKMIERLYSPMREGAYIHEELVPLWYLDYLDWWYPAGTTRGVYVPPSK